MKLSPTPHTVFQSARTRPENGEGGHYSAQEVATEGAAPVT
jgi:hypothetical protein